MTSEKGAMIGMVNAALADPEGIIRLMSVCIRYITPKDTIFPASPISEAKECKMGSMICPSCSIWIIPPASPTTMAADNMSLAPSMNCLMIASACSLLANPERMPIARKMADISGKYQPWPMTPIIRKRIVNASKVNIKNWLDLRKPSQPKTANKIDKVGTA